MLKKLSNNNQCKTSYIALISCCSSNAVVVVALPSLLAAVFTTKMPPGRVREEAFLRQFDTTVLYNCRHTITP